MSKIRTAPVRGIDLKAGDIVLYASMHYMQVVSEAAMPNGLLLSPVPGITNSSVRNITGNPGQTYDKVDAEAFAAAKSQLRRHPSSGLQSGQTHSDNSGPPKQKVEEPASNEHGGGMPAAAKSASPSALDKLIAKPVGKASK